jgi:hypothetical protein
MLVNEPTSAPDGEPSADSLDVLSVDLSDCCRVGVATAVQHDRAVDTPTMINEAHLVLRRRTLASYGCEPRRPVFPL